MDAPMRKCCDKRHWESEWECPNKDPDESRSDFTIVEQPKPVHVITAAPKAKIVNKRTHGRKRKRKTLVFDPILDRKGSTATDLSKRTMRSRRRREEYYREYMRLFMQRYRKKKIAERQAKEEKVD